MTNEPDRSIQPQQTLDSRKTGLIFRFSRTRDGRIFLIRQSYPTDAKRLVECIEQTSGESDYLTFGPGEYGMTVEQQENQLRSTMGSPFSLSLIAVLDDVIIGYLVIWTPLRRSRIRHLGEMGMSVLRTYWGLSVGSSLLDCALDWVKSNPVIVKVNLRVRTDNQRAIALYQRHGFAVEGTIKKEICIAGQFYDSHIMGIEPV